MDAELVSRISSTVIYDLYIKIYKYHKRDLQGDLKVESWLIENNVGFIKFDDVIIMYKPEVNETKVIVYVDPLFRGVDDISSISTMIKLTKNMTNRIIVDRSDYFKGYFNKPIIVLYSSLLPLKRKKQFTLLGYLRSLVNI